MNFRIFGLIISAFVVSLSFTPAAFACTELDPCDPPAEDDPVKGNNGWGNGSDEDADGNGGTNAGSNSGGTAGSKSINGLGTPPGPAKFTER
jgi:hypothetical protein